MGIHFPTAAIRFAEFSFSTAGGLQFRIRRQEHHQLNFKLRGRIKRSDARTIQQALDQLAGKGSLRKEGNEFIVEAEMEGASAKELNGTLLSALRKVNKSTTLRAEWTSGHANERFFDYVLKKTIKD